MSDSSSNSCNEKHQSRLRSKRARIVAISAQKERSLSIKKISQILRKDESKRTKEEADLLLNYSEIVKEATLGLEKRRKLKERLKEVEDVESVIDEKCKQLAEAVSKAEYLVVYTGAGISTSARIPDYRGTAGIWTLLQQGKDIGSHDLTQAEPTYTHMALSQLYLEGKLKHVVSQNCDGLHLRSGLPKRALSEVHGNMYIEVCRSCRPIVEYLRLFDVTEYTARYSHKTMRRCYKCNNPLVDSIVHFGERGSLPWPLNWKGACKAAEKADMILCMGSSLKVLKRYPWLWSMDKPATRRPHLYIVNLQWTPKDYQATIKINGKCDIVMKKVMKFLSINVPRYSKKCDPIFVHATPLCKEETHTTCRPQLILSKKDLQDDEEVKGENVNVESKDIAYGGDKFSDSFDEGIKIKMEDTKTNVVECLITDTGQTGNETNFLKKDLILITIKSSEDMEECCPLFKRMQAHDTNCIHFIDENLDIPIIMHDDLPSSEKLKGIITLEETHVNATKISVTENENYRTFGGIIFNEHQRQINQLEYFSNTQKRIPVQSTGNSVQERSLNVNANIPHEIKEISAQSDFSVLSNESTLKSNTAITSFVMETTNQDGKALFQCSKRSLKNKSETPATKKIKHENKEDDEMQLQDPSPSETETFSTERTSVKSIENIKNFKSEKDKVDLKSVKETSVCSFCSEKYLSGNCLFYMKRESAFEDGLPHCECCEESEDGEMDDNGEINHDIDKCDKNKLDEDSSEGKSKELQKVINPGWYGKGFRKRCRKK